MRILAIRGERLASLHEPFEVDFEAAPLAGAGLFAITGPTGAGKSTLLDAVCLALYGDTPRVEGIGGATIGLGLAEGDADPRLPVKDARHILSRGSRHGHAEVDFRGQDGQRYRARWEVALRPRARALAEPVMSLVRLADSQPLARNRTDTRREVERIVGFTFAEFQKAVLLPQGQFAEFLRADPKARADILEKVAGGEIYARLGALAADRLRRDQAALEQLEAEAGGHQPLDDSARAAAAADRDAAAAEVESARAREQSLRAALAEADRTEEARAAAARERRARGDAEGGAADAARRARALAGEAEEARAAVVAEAARARPQLEEARRLDEELRLAKTGMEDAARLARAAHAEAGAARARATSARDACAAHEKARDDAEGWLAARAGEAAVLTEWPRWRERIERHAEAVRRAAAARKARDEAATPEAVEEATAAAAQATALRDAAASAAKAAVAALDGAEEAERDAKARLETARCALQRARDAQGLAARRAELRRGEPCPLCGATEHPWADSSEVDAWVTVASEAAGVCETGLGAASAELTRARATAERAGKAAAKATGDVEARVAALRTLEQELSRAGRASAERELARAEVEARECEAALASPFEKVAGWREALAADPAALAGAWERRAKEHAVRRAARDDATAALTPSMGALASAEATSKEKAVAAAAAAERLAAARDQVQALGGARAGLLGGRPASEVEAGFTDRLGSAETALGRARGVAQEAEAEAAATAATRRAADERLAGAAAEAATAATALSTVLAGLGVERAGVDGALREAAAATRAADGRRVAAMAALVNDAKARAALEALGPRLDALRARHRVSARLADLIGSQGARSFRTFAQGLALDALLGHANRHLEQLAPRYRLARVPGTDMDLQIVDQELGGAARGVNSLSGGETFLVSLGLALGLSGLATRAACVESLFVDEGFGALDPETLDQAMSVLEGLQATGRTVGVISHVPELHERIGVLVQIDKLGAGRSRVRSLRLGR